MKIINIIGARPQFIKYAPISRMVIENNKLAIDESSLITNILVHTGQHYDYLMSKVFFDELGISEPNYNLGVGSGYHGWQTGEMLKGIEDVLLKEKPDWVMVYGDTNSTLAGALAAVKLHIPVAHVEAGLRSYNRKMPEEINRIFTDYASSILFCPTENAVNNLLKEGFSNIINNGKLIEESLNSSDSTIDSAPIIVNVGDVMYDAMLASLEIAQKKSNVLITYDLLPKTYYLATIHRAENADDPERFKNIIEAFVEISRTKQLIWPVHPRNRKYLKSLTLPSTLRLIDPVSYFDMLILEKNAEKIFTDSGGVQKEAYLMRVPCITLRDETEWVETVESRWNIIVGTNKDKIIEGALTSFSNLVSDSHYGDGRAADKIIKVLKANERSKPTVSQNTCISSEYISTKF